MLLLKGSGRSTMYKETNTNIKNIKINCLGYQLEADLYERSSDEILLVLIGYSSSKESYHDLVTSLVENTNTSALVVDYSGHGVSPFDLTDVSPAQNFLEVIQAFDWLREKYPTKKINVMGTSYGGFLAVQLTKYRKFDRLVLRVPAIYKPEDFYTKWGIRQKDQEAYLKSEKEFRIDEQALASHPLLARASKFEGKTFVVVHENDELVPRETTDAYINAFNADSYLAEGFAHSYASGPEVEKPKYKKVIADWLNKDK